jgi:hypothetical protein
MTLKYRDKIKKWSMHHGMRFNIIFYIMPGGGGVEATF